MRELLIATAVMAVLVTPGTARPCTCGFPEPPFSSLLKADAVFVGTVISSVPTSQSGVMRTTLQVRQAWKGVRSYQVDVMSSTETSMCGRVLFVGESYFVYATSRETICCGRQLGTSLCSRTRLLQYATEDLDAFRFSVEVSTWGNVKAKYE